MIKSNWKIRIWKGATVFEIWEDGEMQNATVLTTWEDSQEWLQDELAIDEERIAS